jgi:hypothetical protein
MDELASLDQSNAESPLERFRRIELYIAGWKNLRRLKRQIPKLQQHNCGIWAKILPPSSRRFSVQERLIQYGSEGLDSIEHLTFNTNVKGVVFTVQNLEESSLPTANHLLSPTPRNPPGGKTFEPLLMRI